MITSAITRAITKQITRPLTGGNSGPINLHYTFDGIAAYISLPTISLVAGDTVEFTMNHGASSGSNEFILDNRDVSGTMTFLINSSSQWQFAGVTASVDGAPIISGSPASVFDGLPHNVVITVLGGQTLNRVCTRNTLASYYLGVLYNLKINDGSVYSYPINDGWAANPVIGNLGSGADATAVNFQEGGWSEVAPPVSGLTFISLEEIASARLFGATSHTFNLTAPAETDGVVFVALVQKKNQGINITSIKVDGGAVVDAMHSVDSNPGGATNQLTAFEDKTFAVGAHTVEVDNLDGIEGATIVAVYYKNYTGLTGNFTGAGATGVQPEELNIGNASWSVTAGNRGLNIVFAGGLNSALSQTPDPEYSSGVMTYNTTNVNNDPYNGVLKTAADLSFVAPVSDQQWLVKWTSAGTTAEVISLGAELSNT